LEVGLWALFFHGFRYLRGLGGIGLVLIGQLFAVFFLGLGLMLVFSSAVTTYESLYRSDEVPFMVSRPFTVSMIVVDKFLESASLASWAFFFIIVPFVGAYAQHEQVSLFLALWTLLFSVPFLFVCCTLGALVTMALVRWFPGGSWPRRMFFSLLALAALGVWIASRTLYDPLESVQFNLSRLAPGLKVAANPLLPSWWVAEGITSLAHGAWGRGFMLWCVVASTAMLGIVAVEWFGRRVFYAGWQRVVAGTGRRTRAPVMLRGLERSLEPLPHDIRAMLLKDLRTFLRDPMQWSQALIFFGLLGIYFSNLRHFDYHMLPARWRNTIVFFNVFSVSAVMCSLGSRFVYPQLSMEGQGFWILGLSPTTMKRVLLTKFLASLLGMLTVSCGLMLLSCRTLQAGPLTTAVALGLATAESLAVCGLSTGLGAVFLDLRKRSPAAIVSGFGGTLNLVLNLIFMLSAIVPFAILFHLRAAHGVGGQNLRVGLIVIAAWVVGLTLAATWIPLALGARALHRREF
jgi:ABC-2 type transport system permease protein